MSDVETEEVERNGIHEQSVKKRGRPKKSSNETEIDNSAKRKGQSKSAKSPKKPKGDVVRRTSGRARKSDVHYEEIDEDFDMPDSPKRRKSDDDGDFKSYVKNVGSTDRSHRGGRKSINYAEAADRKIEDDIYPEDMKSSNGDGKNRGR